MTARKKVDIEAKQDSKRRKILQAYYELVAEDGLENCSMAKIAKKIGIPSSLIFHYFTNKQEMTYSLVDYVLELCEGKDTITSDYPVDERGLRQFLEFMIKPGSGDNTEDIMFFACKTMAFRDDVVREKFRQHDNRIIDSCSDVIKQYIEAGIVANINAPDAGLMICAAETAVKDMADDYRGEDQFKRFLEYQITSTYDFLTKK